jgi:hypothetical protein
MCSLLGAAWLASSALAADTTADATVPGLHPLNGPTPQANLQQPPGLMPVVKPVGPTLYYQKDAAPTDHPVIATIPTLYQDPTPPKNPAAETTLPPSATNTRPPAIAEIQVNTEASLRAEIKAEVIRYMESPIFGNFPQNYDPMTKSPFEPRAFQATVQQVEPTYVCYRRLYFEDKDTERYGWELGVLQPVVSLGKFYLDMAMFPYNFATRPCQRFEANAGYCLPGDPVPYLIYPTEFSIPGGLAEAGVIVGLAAIFP